MGFVDFVCGGGLRWLWLLRVLWILFMAVACSGCGCSGFLFVYVCVGFEGRVSRIEWVIGQIWQRSVRGENI